MALSGTIAQIQKALASGEISSVDLISSAFSEIERDDGDGDEIFVRTFKNAAITQAAASDAMRKMGVPQGALAGIPISVKDLFDVEGAPTTAGSAALASVAEPARRDAAVMARLRAAGAIFLGHTNMTEFAYSGLGINPHFGTPLNVWDRHIGRVPGGSSSGAALSITSNMAVAAIGSDTGGSVRIPAAFNRLYGFKPTTGRHPMEGVFPLSTTLDTVGALARSMHCCRILDHVMAGLPVPEPDIRPISGLRFGILETIALDGLDMDVAGAFVRALETISRAGARLERIKIDALHNFEEISSLGSIAGPEAFHKHRDFIIAHGRQIDQRVLSRLEASADISAADYIEMLALRKDMIERTHLATRNFDAILMPTVAIIPPEVKPLLASDALYAEANFKVLRNTALINNLGRPAATIPVGVKGGAPVGLMVVGEHGADAHVQNIAESLDEVLMPKRN
ncbi:amidase [uncultured Cohaesibacter sp.]|uniref:amidase n=1 Tax=uncultured Cohaesibacter sp. TaxID=1002546 RepID=UPI0029C7C829|nr:amidase [uncultured Cohaesibacter sp.]